jgi:hypothetical protein
VDGARAGKNADIDRLAARLRDTRHLSRAAVGEGPGGKTTPLGDRAGTTGAAVLAIEHIVAPQFVDAH